MVAKRSRDRRHGTEPERAFGRPADRKQPGDGEGRGRDQPGPGRAARDDRPEHHPKPEIAAVREQEQPAVPFAEPGQLRPEGAAGGGVEPDERNLAVQKIAFEMAVRVNRVTPITATALVALVFLGEDDRAMTLGEVRASLTDIVGFVRRRALPTTGALGLDTDAGVERALAAMVENGVFRRYAEGREPLYGIASEQHLAAAIGRTVRFAAVGGALWLFGAGAKKWLRV